MFLAKNHEEEQMQVLKKHEFVDRLFFDENYRLYRYLRTDVGGDAWCGASHGGFDYFVEGLFLEEWLKVLVA